MSRTRRALIALVAIAGFILLAALMGATLPPRGAPAAEPLAAAQLVPSATPTLPLATATPLPPTPTLARREFPSTYGVKVAPTSFLPGRGPELPGDFVYAGRRLDFYVGQGTFSPEEVAELAIKAEHALSYLQKRFAVTLSERVSVGVYAASQAPGKGTRGIAYTHGDTNVRIYYRPGEDQHNALVVLSHELAHALQAEAYGKDAQRRADTVLLEGLACWISGEYWLSLSEAPSFHARARELYQAGYRGNLGALGRGNLNNAYDMWAGFVDYLTRAYGWDAFNTLYASGRGRAAGSADYRTVYGKSFQDLQEEFYATLR
ncbi:MAG: hypothetical protein N2378_04560 [Chloroflexaceae bacterium]|nr:hypothetical protein [Chloroflexaceae bacterium]